MSVGACMWACVDVFAMYVCNYVGTWTFVSMNVRIYVYVRKYGWMDG